jgi:hypothetical protein
MQTMEARRVPMEILSVILFIWIVLYLPVILLLY